MSSSDLHCDPRIAPAVDQLAVVAARVHDVWARMGVSAMDRQRRWDAFLHASLLPFVGDFCALQESAEFNAATENDVLLREVCYLATRLEEAPRHADVAVIVTLLKQHYTRTPMSSPLRRRLQRDPAVSFLREPQRESADSDESSGSGNVAAPAAARRSTKELVFPSLPSFAELLKQQSTEHKAEVTSEKETQTATSTDKMQWIASDDDRAEEDAAEEEEQQKSTVAAPDPHTACGAKNEEAAEEESIVAALENEGITSPLHFSTTADAMRALQRMMQANTHEGVRQQLQTELDRLKSLADNRLRVLQLLCKQRAILTRSPAEQVALRTAYRVKYLGTEEQISNTSELEARSLADVGGPADTSNRTGETSALAKAVPVMLSTSADLVAATTAVTEPSISPPASSSNFASLPPSPKSSGHSTATTTLAPSRITAETRDAPQLLHECGATAAAPGTATLRATTQAELLLLLSADSCTLDPPAVWTSVEQQQRGSHRSEEDSAIDGSNTTWPTCSSTTVTVAVSQRRTSHATTALPDSTHPPPPPPPSSSLAGRSTVFQMDVSSITAYGTHQDLSLKRVQQEAESILGSIAEHNRRMQAETNEELQALETLEVLWRAMAAPKASPNVSSQGGHAERGGGGEDGRNGDAQATHPGVTPKPKMSRMPVAVADTLLVSLQPAPFAELREQVLARYARLQEAFAADVAAQQATSPFGNIFASVDAASNATAPSLVDGSPPSSLSSSARPTGASSLSSTSPSSSKAPSTRTTHGVDSLRKDARVSGCLYLPPIVRQVLRAPSFAPVLDYVHRTRVAFQKHLSTQQDALVEEIMARLRTVYADYYAVTRDSAYAVAPDGELRVAMEEELLETLQASELKPCPTSSDLGSETASIYEEHQLGGGGGAVVGAGKILLGFQRHLAACQQVREQAGEELELLRLRLHIIDQAEPLVLDYQTVLREEAEMQAGSRERLLSKKVNMAKQLLQEEKHRRRVAKDLPRIVAHLSELVAAWSALQVADVHNEDDLRHRSNSSSNNNNAESTSSACGELCIHGQRVRDLVAGASLRTGTAAAATPSSLMLSSSAVASRTRPRSVSMHAAPTSRSVSPAPPAVARTRTESSCSSFARPHSTSAGQRNASPAHGRHPPTPHRRATPSPQPSASREGRLLERAPGGTSRSPSFASSTAAAAAKRTPALTRSRTPPPPSLIPPISAVHASSQPSGTHHRCSPTPPLVPSMGVGSRVRSLSPSLRQGLSARTVNTPVVRHTSKSRSPAPVSGTPAGHRAIFSSNFTARH
ncbi:hypothetical protein ABB37_08780 [Leptomonas pyrrhocoris]|uniref:Uncharacterized protein n=1 Tax=Leptomonas pyrrhocoris TaxID=157538 RepID=A0A0N0DRT7_LEPPY|nr:hypothetical protein ABB37_08780 [Leptomonas pyrrhocoris]KPA75112.1 hypothetical protein ABB37_08780 [Leptomonas pyrrhocoris]|eukprot:XP_015653551.1 hypothetical protein ABB37_08780 [Leptomonas pyrrhocoris]